MQENSGYTSVTSYKSGFIAVGDDGRIDHISTNGKISQTEKFPEIQFNCIVAADQVIIAAGNNGNIVISKNNQPFKKTESGSKENINSLTYFDELIIAGTNGGELLLGDTDGFFQMIRLNVKGNITSLSSRDDICYGVTDEGEIIHSKDGLNWEVFNFNQTYAGFYKPCSFTKILAANNNIAVIGIREDNTPTIFFSNLGNVWTERTLNYTDDNGMDVLLEEIPNDIYYDETADEYYVVCTNGKILILPNCSHCNTHTTVSENDLNGIAFNQNTVLVVGSDYFVQSFTIR
ncbi:MAG: hypothetical protein JXR61_11830 [Prolixibacteraceae bacterium]|nr:hypothetical protein [Prolixibacteraceae bacterium]